MSSSTETGAKSVRHADQSPIGYSKRHKATVRLGPIACANCGYVDSPSLKHVTRSTTWSLWKKSVTRGSRHQGVSMKLHDLKPRGSKKDRKRIERGPAGQGKTAGRAPKVSARSGVACTTRAATCHSSGDFLQTGGLYPLNSQSA
jgi:hypothetical protein